MNGKLAKLQSTLLDKEAEIERLKSQLAATPTVVRQSAQVSRLNADIANLQKQLQVSAEQASRARTALKAEKAARSKLEAENARLRDRLRSHQ